MRIPKHDTEFVPAPKLASGPVIDSPAPNQSSQLDNICPVPRRIPPPVNDVYLEEVISDPELELMPEHEDEPNLTVEMLPDQSTNTHPESANLQKQQKPTGIRQPRALANVGKSNSSDDGTIEETLDPLRTLPVDLAPESTAAPSRFTENNEHSGSAALGNMSVNEIYVDKKVLSNDQKNVDLLDKTASVSDGFLEPDVNGRQLESKKERDADHCKSDKDSIPRNLNMADRANGYTECGIHVKDAANAAGDDCNNNDIGPRQGGARLVSDNESKSNILENKRWHCRRRSSYNYPVRRGGSSARGVQRSTTCSHALERMEDGPAAFGEKSEQVLPDKDRVSCVLVETKSSVEGNFDNNMDASWQRHNSDIKFESSKDEKEGVASDSPDEASISRAKPLRPFLTQQKVKREKSREATKRRILPGKAFPNIHEPGRLSQKRIGMSAGKGRNKQPGHLEETKFQSEWYESEDSDGEDIDEAIKAGDQLDDESDENWDELNEDIFGDVEEGFETLGGSASEELVKDDKKVSFRRRCIQKGSTGTESELEKGESTEQELLNNDIDEDACVTKSGECSLKEECSDIMAKDDDPENNSKLSAEEKKPIVGHKTRGRGRPRGSRKNHTVVKVDKGGSGGRICKSDKDENTKSEFLSPEEGGILSEQICARKQQVRSGRGRPRRMANNPSKAKIDAEKDENYKCTAGLAESRNSLHSSAQINHDLSLSNNDCEGNGTEINHTSEELVHREARSGGKLEANQEKTEGKINLTVHDKRKLTMGRSKGIASDEFENDTVKIVPFAKQAVGVPSEVENETVLTTPIRKGRKKRKASILSSESKSDASSPPNDIPNGTDSLTVAGFGRTAEGRTFKDELYMPPDLTKENDGVYAKKTPTRSSPRFRGKKRRVLVVESETSYESPSANVYARRTHVPSEGQHRDLQGDDDISNENGEEEGTDDENKPSDLKKRRRGGVETRPVQRGMSKRGVGVRFTVDGERSQGRRRLKSQETQRWVEEEDEDSKMRTGCESDAKEPPGNEISEGEEKTPPRPTVRKRGRPSRRGASGKGGRGPYLGRKRGRERESAYLDEEKHDGEHSGCEKLAKGSKRRKFMTEVLKLQKALASAAWTDSREVEAQTEVKVIGENVPETIIQGVESAHPVTNTEESRFNEPVNKGAKAIYISSPKAKN